jgi:hypothetical protein
MAFVLAWYESVFQLVDRGGNSTTRTYRQRQTDTAGDISDLITAQNTVLTALDAITDCVIKSVRLARVTFNDAFALPAVDSAEVEMHALITAKIFTNPLKSATIDVPGPNIGIFQGTTGKPFNQVDPADTALVTFLNEFTGATPDFLVSDGEAITQVDLAGKRTHSRSTKG